MCSEPTELRLIGCLTESTWTPKSKSHMLTPRTNLRTCWPKVISRMMSRTIFCVCSTSWAFRCSLAAIFFQFKSRAKCRRALRKEGQKKNLWWRNQSQHVWYQETWRQNNPLVGFGCFIQPGEARIGSELCVHEAERSVRDRVQNPTASSQEWQRDDNPFSCAGRLVRVMGERSSAGRPVRGIQNQLARTKLDSHTMQISDNQYLEKAFTNVHQKLNRTANEKIFDQKVNALGWWLFKSTTMKAALQLGHFFIIWLPTGTQIC